MSYKTLCYKDLKRTVLNDLNNYVTHSDIVYKKSNINGLRTDRIFQEIEIIKNYVCELNSYSSLFNICLKIYKLRKRLVKILPHPNNNSYINQSEKIHSLINYSAMYVQTIQQERKQLITA